MWPFSSKKPSAIAQTPIFFTNTLTKKKEAFHSQKPGIATIYTCGPTVYSRIHIGNMRAYVFADLIARTLRAAGCHVRQVINITDVGHLVGDADEGQDKIEMGAKAEGLSVEALTGRYTKQFIDDLGLLNIDTTPILFPRATEYIAEQIKMVQELEKKGFTYRTHDGIYFDTSRFPEYGKLGGISEAELKTGDATTLEDRITIAAGRRIAENKDKRHPADFALWKFSSLNERRLQEWPSLWGRGFPGWHLECSAMIRAILGNEIDVHTGGIDHIPIHHNNEIAQSESVLGKPFVRYWMHGAFLTIEGVKISKSLKNGLYVSDFSVRGIHPLAFRYFLLQAHYRSPLSFSWEALEASAEALTRLWRLSATILLASKGMSVPTEAQERIITLLHDDLGTPQALAYLWEILRDEDITAKEKRAVIEAAEPILGLSLLHIPEAARLFTSSELPDAIQSLVKDREKARVAGEFEKADTLREKLRNRGYHVEDRPEGPLLTIVPK
ncbi:cysteine--tRNA ligase [Patescibacteria group bacterium]|nr:cysteine--tRNA ligase [Patescibacteria group bacterium]